MKVEYYNPVDEKNGCIVRSISKALNRDYIDIKNELINMSNNYYDEDIFEKYLKEHNFYIDNSYNNKKLSDIFLDGINIVLAYNNDWYHMVCIIDNVIFDKNDYNKLKDLKIIKVYRLN